MRVHREDGVSPLFLVFHEIPDEKRNQRNDKAQDPRCILARKRQKMRERHRKRPRMYRRIEDDIEPPEKSEDKEGERGCLDGVHADTLPAFPLITKYTCNKEVAEMSAGE